MDRIVSTETLALKTGECVHNRFFPKGKLVLHYDVNHRMKLRIWQFDLLATMIGRNQLDPIAFVGSQPVRWRW